MQKWMLDTLNAKHWYRPTGYFYALNIAMFILVVTGNFHSTDFESLCEMT